MQSINNHSGILSAIGNTPVARLERLFAEFEVDVYAKLEYLNPSGSIKDRTSYILLTEAIEANLINSETVIIESTSGNMGVGLAQACKYLGLKLILVVDPLINPSTEKLLNLYGANVHKVSGADESGTYLAARLAYISELQTNIPNSFWTNQYSNKNTLKAHRDTISELKAQLGGELDYLFVPTSTCGTIMSCALALADEQMDTKLIPVDAVGSKIFSDQSGKRKIPGMGASRKSDYLIESMLEVPEMINDHESIVGCHRLMEREAILAGGSTGAVVAAIAKRIDTIPKNSKIAFFISDRGERYLDTIFSSDWVREHISADAGVEKENTSKSIR
ncbi:2,3-diaminopropionate biosynthesis protein SbnA [Algoriphagus sp.]|uniref:2,3-diaminopropionate biosynthesis protein SbnA n=1 Tax=Algoriphagus sp. TaxID=1872435 RepID=UPI00327EFF94